MIYVILALVIVSCLLGILYLLTYNKYQFINIKLQEAENVIEFYLKSKLDFYTRLLNILDENLNIKNDKLKQFKSVDIASKSKKLIDEDLEEVSLLIHDLIDNNEKIAELESISEIKEELKEANINLIAGKNYYNDNIVLYNSLIKCFPSNIIGKILKYKEKEFFSNKKEEDGTI